MKLSEIKGEKAIEAFADLLEPLSEILADDEVREGIENDLPKLLVIQKAMKKHSKAIIKVMAILDCEDPETYEVNFLMIPVKLGELFTDTALVDLFTSQGQNVEKTPSGSATENTGENAV